MRKVQIFSGTSHPELSNQIVQKLGHSVSLVHLKHSANKEITVELGVSVRDEDVFIIQSGSDSMNDHLMELLMMVNACKAASAKRITAVIPYYPYNKQSKKKGRGTISAKLVANMLAVAGVQHIITVDLHSSQMQGFFSMPVDNLVAEPSIAKYIHEKIPNYETGVIISKNAGATKRVTSLADRLNMDFGLIHREKYHINEQKAADSEKGGSKGFTRLTLVGDVRDKICFLVDDIIDSPKSYLDAAQHLKTVCGATTVYIIATHAMLSGNSLQEIEECPHVHQIIATNTYPISEEKRKIATKLQVIDISSVLSEAIRRTHNGESISYLFHNLI
ncbi:phosphoribosyltransferase-like protein [Polychytrium aggregatum]|uniref:phosphoribosyltransferase-like protein n=1 Tax=Polychytrium aggregatum TaxID=110093 RepID=UPI0022FF2864|nr:phosphoribosyltransferase-like protein [Polychytrium aggregatum]KAI9202388.1 phosphoribosyltransferase-like protein [Polychytrium aggregatum]